MPPPPLTRAELAFLEELTKGPLVVSIPGLDGIRGEATASVELEIEVGLPAPSGGMRISCSLGQAMAAAADPAAFAAKAFACTPEQWAAWILQEGTPHCGGLTKAGKRCRQPIGRSQMKIADWLDLDGSDYCRIHGG